MELFWVHCGMSLSAVQVPEKLCCPSWFLFQQRGLNPAVCRIAPEKSMWGWSLPLPPCSWCRGVTCQLSQLHLWKFCSYSSGPSCSLFCCSASAWHPGFWYTWTCWFHWGSISRLWVSVWLALLNITIYTYNDCFPVCLEMHATFQLCGVFVADVPLLLQLPI